MDQQELKRVWRNLHLEPESRKILAPEIADSWERSYQCGVNPWLRDNPYVATQAEIKEALDQSEYFIRLARPVMESLYQFVAGTGFIVTLNNTDIMGFDIIADSEMLEWAKNSRLFIGSLWSENLVGTNSASLALALGKPVSVIGHENFCQFAYYSASSAVPIIDRGKILGVLCMTAPYNHMNHHTLGMVVAAVRHIESNIILERAKLFHQETIDSMSEGLIVVNENGKILGSNIAAARILRASYPLSGQELYNILELSHENQQFISMATRARSAADETITLTFNGERNQYNVTYNPLDNDDAIVVIMRESHKIDRLVRHWIGGNAKVTFDQIIGNNAKFVQVLQNAQCASSSNSNVLITGESGVGKDLIAQSMHNASPRRNHPFVAINCAALPRDLIASELFGYEDGAFTGARKGGNIGKFELADQGTIFLDEIADMPIGLQASLLRVLEEHSVMRLGGTKMIPINVRVIAATNKNLEVEMNRNRFRRDLFYRLGVVRLNVPPLRDRKDDIPLFVQHFIDNTCKQLKRKPVKVSYEVMKVLEEYHWPGNVRELQNIIESAIQLTTTSQIELDHIQEFLTTTDDLTQIESSIKSMSTIEHRNWNLAQNEKQIILDCLKSHNNNKSKTAEALGIPRRTLYDRLKTFGIS